MKALALMVLAVLMWCVVLGCVGAVLESTGWALMALGAWWLLADGTVGK